MKFVFRLKKLPDLTYSLGSLWLSFSHCTANLMQITVNIGKIGTALYTKFTVNKSCEFTVFTVSQNYVGFL